MNIRKAFKYRLLSMVSAILLVFAATSALAVKTTNCSPLNLIDTTWGGPLQEVVSHSPVQVTVKITNVEKVGDSLYNISGYISYRYKTVVVTNVKMNKSYSNVFCNNITLTNAPKFPGLHISGRYINNKIHVDHFCFARGFTDGGDLVPGNYK